MLTRQPRPDPRRYRRGRAHGQRDVGPAARARQASDHRPARSHRRLVRTRRRDGALRELGRARAVDRAMRYHAPSIAARHCLALPSRLVVLVIQARVESSWRLARVDHRRVGRVRLGWRLRRGRSGLPADALERERLGPGSECLLVSLAADASRTRAAASCDSKVATRLRSGPSDATDDAPRALKSQSRE